MEKYIGTKLIEAKPMTRGEFNEYQGVSIPKNDACYNNEGYFVRYPDNYESWSPKRAFEDAYRKSGEMTFGHAIELLKIGCRLARKGWNGKGMFLFIADEIEFVTKADLKAYEKSGVDVHDSICMLTADGEIVVGWLASQTDMLAEDWEVVDS